jgi:hypothetical protein
MASARPDRKDRLSDAPALLGREYVVHADSTRIGIAHEQILPRHVGLATKIQDIGETVDPSGEMLVQPGWMLR